MRPDGPKHWLLDERTGWRTATLNHVTDRGSLELAGGNRGTWTSVLLDSRVHRCTWDRVELDLAELPARAVVEVRTATFDTPTVTGGAPEWVVSGRYSAPDGGERDVVVDWPVRALPGRYLAIQLDLVRFTCPSPAVRAVRAHYPRATPVDFLPGVFRVDDRARDLLERVLGGLDVRWQEVARSIADITTLVDPRAVPDGAPLRFLASWFGIRVPTKPPGAARRHLLAELAVLRERGTPRSLRVLLQALLTDLTGVDRSAGAFPAFVEGSGTGTPWLVLHRRTRAELGRSRLWSPSRAGRLRIGSYSTVGVARLRDVGDENTDRAAVTTTGHRFRVYLPRAWVRDAAAERAVRDLIDATKPATCVYDLTFIDSRVVVGVQSTVGVDTIVGAVAPPLPVIPAPER